MRARIAARLDARRRANAALCGLPLTEWLALPRRERKRRLRVEALVAAPQPVPHLNRKPKGVRK